MTNDGPTVDPLGKIAALESSLIEVQRQLDEAKRATEDAELRLAMACSALERQEEAKRG